LPRLTSLSLRSTAHPESFQRQWVRSSTYLSISFNLAMDRSRGFGSIMSYLFALFRLGFPTPTHQRCLSLQDIITRWSIMQKVRRQPFIPEGMHRPSTACRFIISGSISLPSRGSFQLSLTVLVHFRSD
jgi:hypothetical protein